MLDIDRELCGTANERVIIPAAPGSSSETIADCAPDLPPSHRQANDFVDPARSRIQMWSFYGILACMDHYDPCYAVMNG